MNRIAILSAVVLLLALSACTEDEAELKADACTQIAELNQAVAAFNALGPTSTVGQFRDAADKVWNEAYDAALAVRAVGNVRYQELRQAQSDLWDARHDVPDSATVPQAIQQVAPQIKGVVDAAKNVTSSLGCQ
jgi:hypothetical protein